MLGRFSLETVDGTVMCVVAMLLGFVLAASI